MRRSFAGPENSSALFAPIMMGATASCWTMESRASVCRAFLIPYCAATSALRCSLRIRRCAPRLWQTGGGGAPTAARPFPRPVKTRCTALPAQPAGHAGKNGNGQQKTGWSVEKARPESPDFTPLSGAKTQVNDTFPINGQNSVYFFYPRGTQTPCGTACSRPRTGLFCY